MGAESRTGKECKEFTDHIRREDSKYARKRFASESIRRVGPLHLPTLNSRHLPAWLAHGIGLIRRGEGGGEETTSGEEYT